MVLNIPYTIYQIKYYNFINAIVNKTSLNTNSILRLTYDINKGNVKLLKTNNFFAVKNIKATFFHKYPTPYEGILAGIDIILKDPEFMKNKIGTLKGNENLQYFKLRSLLKL